MWICIFYSILYTYFRLGPERLPLIFDERASTDQVFIWTIRDENKKTLRKKMDQVEKLPT